MIFEDISNFTIKVIENEGNTSNWDSPYIKEQSVQACLLFGIIQKLEEIRCGLIDIEEEIKKVRTD